MRTAALRWPRGVTAGGAVAAVIQCVISLAAIQPPQNGVHAAVTPPSYYNITAHTCGNALYFDGRRRRDVAVLGPPSLGSALAPNGNATVDFWLKLLDPYEDVQTLVSYSSKTGLGTIRDNDFAIYAQPWGAIAASLCNTFTAFDVSSLPPRSSHLPLVSLEGNSRWFHVALVFCTTCADWQFKIYVDGMAYGDASSTIFLSGTRDDLSQCKIAPSGCPLLGQDADSLCDGFDPTQSFAGLLDELRVWDVVMTEEQIAAAAVVDDVLPYTGALRLHYRFDEFSEADSLFEEVSLTALGLLGVVTTTTTCGAGQMTRPRRVVSTVPAARQCVSAKLRSIVVDPSDLYASNATASRMTLRLVGKPPPLLAQHSLVIVLVSPPVRGILQRVDGSIVHANGTIAPCAPLARSDGLVVCEFLYGASLGPMHAFDAHTWAQEVATAGGFEDIFRYAFVPANASSVDSSTLTTSVSVRMLCAMDEGAILAHESADTDQGGVTVFILGGVATDGTALDVNITSVPTNGALYIMPFNLSGMPATYLGTAVGDGSTLPSDRRITAPGTCVRNYRGVVVYKSLTLPSLRRDSFSYRWILPASDTRALYTAERHVVVTVRRRNTAPDTGSPPAVTLSAAPESQHSGEAAVVLRASDPDGSHSNSLFYRVVSWPLWGTLLTPDGRALDAPEVERQLVFTAFAQRVVAFSSEYFDCVTGRVSPCPGRHWNAVQVLERPDVYPFEGDSVLSWCPEFADGPEWEFVELELMDALFVSRITVYETYNAGATAAVYVAMGPPGIRPRDSDWVRLWRWDGPPPPLPPIARAFSPPLCPVLEAVRYVRVEFATNETAGWNEIDSITAEGTTGILSGLLSGPTATLSYRSRRGLHGATFDSFAFAATDCEDWAAPLTVSLRFPSEFVGADLFDPALPEHRRILLLEFFAVLPVSLRPAIPTEVLAFADAIRAAFADWNMTLSSRGLDVPAIVPVARIVHCSMCLSSVVVTARSAPTAGLSQPFVLPMPLSSSEAIFVTADAPADFHVWVTLGSLTYRVLIRLTLACDAGMYTTARGTCGECALATRSEIDADRGSFYASCAALLSCPFAGVDASVSSAGVAIISSVGSLVIGLGIGVSTRVHLRWRAKQRQRMAHSQPGNTAGIVATEAVAVGPSDGHAPPVAASPQLYESAIRAHLPGAWVGTSISNDEWETVDTIEVITIAFSVLSVVAAVLSSEYALKADAGSDHVGTGVRHTFSGIYVRWGSIRRTLFFPILYLLLALAAVWVSLMSLLYFGVLERIRGSTQAGAFVRMGIAGLTYVCGLLGAPLFMPTCGYFLAVFNCIDEFQGHSYLRADCTYQCSTSRHVGIATGVGITLCTYVPFAVYIRPLWPMLQEKLHVKGRPHYIVHSTTLQLFLAVASAFLQGTPAAHATVFAAATAALALLTVKMRPYTQMRINVWLTTGYLCATVAAVVVGAFHGVGHSGSPLAAVLSLILLWAVLIVVALYINKRFPPLRRPHPRGPRDRLSAVNEALRAFRRASLWKSRSTTSVTGIRASLSTPSRHSLQRRVENAHCADTADGGFSQ